jgi:hypothetical protein
VRRGFREGLQVIKAGLAAGGRGLSRRNIFMKAHRLFFGLVVAAGIAGVTSHANGQAVPPNQSPMVQARKAVADAGAAVQLARKAVDAARLKVVATYGAGEAEAGPGEDRGAERRQG